MHKIPVYILHGKLGVGKTTILTNLLERQEFAEALVIENEFAGYSVDGQRLADDHPHVRIYKLSGTCVCCAGSEDLMSTLLELADEQTSSVPIIVETTGAADAANLMKSLLLDESFHQRFDLKANLLVVDALAVHHRTDMPEALESDMLLADYVLVTKTDLLAGEDAKDVIASVRRFVPDRLFVVERGILPKEVQFDVTSSRALETLTALAEVANEKMHATVSWKLLHLPACNTESFVEALAKARSHGAEILRVKGTIRDANGVDWRVDGTEQLSECIRTDRSPGEPTLVLIGTNLPKTLDV